MKVVIFFLSSFLKQVFTWDAFTTCSASSVKFLLGVADRTAKETVSQCYDSLHPDLSAAQSRTNCSDLIYSNRSRLLSRMEAYQALHLLASVIPSTCPFADSEFNYPSFVPHWLSSCPCVAKQRGLNQDQASCPCSIYPGTVKHIHVLVLLQFWLILGWSGSISHHSLHLVLIGEKKKAETRFWLEFDLIPRLSSALITKLLCPSFFLWTNKYL